VLTHIDQYAGQSVLTHVPAKHKVIHRMNLFKFEPPISTYILRTTGCSELAAFNIGAYFQRNKELYFPRYAYKVFSVREHSDPVALREAY